MLSLCWLLITVALFIHLLPVNLWGCVLYFAGVVCAYIVRCFCASWGCVFVYNCGAGVFISCRVVYVRINRAVCRVCTVGVFVYILWSFCACFGVVDVYSVSWEMYWCIVSQ